MIIPDHKKAADIIVGRMGGPEAKMKDEEEIDPQTEGLRSACEDLIAGIQSGSAHDVMAALDSYFAQKEAGGEEPSEEI